MTNTVFHEQFKHLSGLERVQMLCNDKNRIPVGMEANMGHNIVSVEPGKVQLLYLPQEAHMNMIGTIHGGALATLLDTVIGLSITTLLQPGERQTMTDLHIRFLRPVMPVTTSLTVIGEVEKEGKRLISGQASVLNNDGELVARASGGAARI